MSYLYQGYEALHTHPFHSISQYKATLDSESRDINIPTQHPHFGQVKQTHSQNDRISCRYLWHSNPFRNKYITILHTCTKSILYTSHHHSVHFVDDRYMTLTHCAHTADGSWFMVNPWRVIPLLDAWNDSLT